MTLLEITGKAEVHTIKVPLTAKVLVVEDRVRRIDWFRSRIPHAHFADLSHTANAILLDVKPDVVFLDFDLHGFTSLETAKILAATKFAGTIYVHSLNNLGGDILCRILQGLSVERHEFGSFEIRIENKP